MTIGALGPSQLAFLLQGAVWTVVLSLIAIVGGGVLGLAVALCRVSPLAPVRQAASGYIQLVQGTPPLVAMFLLYFGLPGLGVNVPSLVAAGLALVVNVSACIQGVPRAQWEAAECLALSPVQRMVRIILPQAIRVATPPTVGFSVQVIKNTSLASVVGFVELARSGQIVNNSVFQPFAIYAVIAAVYFALCYPLSRLSRVLERRAGSWRQRPMTLAGSVPVVSA